MGVFEQNKGIENIGHSIGYLFSYFLFTTILFFILVLLDKIPSTWTYLHIMAITVLIAAIGGTLKRSLG